MTFLYIIIFILSLALLGNVIFLLRILKVYKNIPQEDKEYINFVIDMYIDYAKELNIYSEKQHDVIVKRLKKIKEKYFI